MLGAAEEDDDASKHPALTTPGQSGIGTSPSSDPGDTTYVKPSQLVLAHVALVIEESLLIFTCPPLNPICLSSSTPADLIPWFSTTLQINTNYDHLTFPQRCSKNSSSVESGGNWNIEFDRLRRSGIPGMSRSFPPPLLCVSLVLATFALLPCPAFTDREAQLEKIFQLRNEDEWKSAWHLEKHVRCRDQLLTHMDWACEKDIYRFDKRSHEVPKEPSDEALEEIFIDKREANHLIKPWSGYDRGKRESKSITDECCSPAGCTWEEYAEYCPTHRRFGRSRRSLKT